MAIEKFEVMLLKSREEIEIEKKLDILLFTVSDPLHVQHGAVAKGQLSCPTKYDNGTFTEKLPGESSACTCCHRD